MKAWGSLLATLGLVVVAVALTPTPAVPQCVKCSETKHCVWGPWAGGFEQCTEFFGYCNAWEDCDEAEDLQLAADGMTAARLPAPGLGEWHSVVSLPGTRVLVACNGTILAQVLSDDAVAEVRAATTRLVL